MSQFFSKAKTILFIVGVSTFIIFLLAITLQPIYADNGESVTATIIRFTDAESLYKEAVQKLNARDLPEAIIYLSAYFYKYQDANTEAVGRSLDSVIAHYEQQIDELQKWRAACWNGCGAAEREEAGLNAIFASPLEELPDYAEEYQASQTMICRGGGQMRFAYEVQLDQARIWVDFARGEEPAGSDRDNTYLLEPGECTLLARRILSHERTELNLQPLLEMEDEYVISWNAAGREIEISPGSINRDESPGGFLNPPPFEGSDGTFANPDAPAEMTAIPIWPALDALESADSFVEFAVALDDNNNFIATKVNEHGPWSKYERIEMVFQQGRLPDSSYDGALDTTIREADPGENFGNLATCFVDGDDPPESNADTATLLRWDISAIPAGSSVKSAAIILNVANPGTENFTVYRLREDWQEQEVTWRSYQSGFYWLNEIPEDSPDRYLSILGSLAAPNLGREAIHFNDAGLIAVQDWVNSPSANQGVMISNPEAINGIGFDCSESSAVLDRPQLRISYVLPQP